MARTKGVLMISEPKDSPNWLLAKVQTWVFTPKLLNEIEQLNQPFDAILTLHRILEFCNEACKKKLQIELPKLSNPRAWTFVSAPFEEPHGIPMEFIQQEQTTNRNSKPNHIDFYIRPSHPQTGAYAQGPIRNYLIHSCHEIAETTAPPVADHQLWFLWLLTDKLSPGITWLSHGCWMCGCLQYRWGSRMLGCKWQR